MPLRLLRQTRDLMLEQIKYSDEIKTELGFLKCGDGSYDECSGTSCEVYLKGCLGLGPIIMDFHTHPHMRGAVYEYFSAHDMLHAHENKRPLSCIGFTDRSNQPRVKCVHRENIVPRTAAQALWDIHDVLKSKWGPTLTKMSRIRGVSREMEQAFKVEEVEL